MEPFLKKIAKTFYDKEKNNLKDCAFIFPNRRAGLFFRKYLAESAEKPIFSPTILTIKDLFEHLSGLKSYDRIQLLFKLYAVYKKITQTEETFDHFLFWGEIMLNDFDDIDKYTVNAEQLFSNLSDLKSLDINPIEYLTTEQLKAIRSFWEGFGEETTSALRKDFITFWKHLQPVYTLFKQELLSEGKAYEGMMMRQVVENLETNGWNITPRYRKIIFIGFNALNKTEERLFLSLKKEGLADFYWDYASDWIKDPSNRSSFFMERNLQLFPSQINIQESTLSQPEIEIKGVASAVAQAKGVAQLLQKIYPPEQAGNSDDWIKTAIVLPDENLLFPLLSSIPEQINRINVTMGYSLSKSAIAGLMDLILELQHNIHDNKGKTEFYYRDVINLINHRYLNPFSKEITYLRTDIIENNRIFLDTSRLHINTLFKAIFRKVDEKLPLYNYLVEILEEIKNNLPEIEENEKEEYDTTIALDHEFIDHYTTLLNKLEISCNKYRTYISADTYFKLLRKLLQTVSIPFQGEPLSGLQVMGVLETRSLDFDNLIILSMNEGIFPLPKGANTLIPYNLRKGFGLPTSEHQDAVYAYHFYRLLQRAKKVHFFYDTRSDGLKSGEVSRYILQLKYLYKVPLSEKLMIYNVGGKEKVPLNIPKTQKVLETLQAFINPGQRYLSASSINTYLQCPLKFYLLYVQQLKENEEIQERVEANIFGSLFHKTMELLYTPYCGRVISSNLLTDMAKDSYLLNKTIRKAFGETIYHGKTIENLEGEHLLIAEILKQYIRQLLKKDAEFAPFEYIASENKIILSFKLTEKTSVNLKALVDRVDKIKGQIRLVDYKTGRGEATFTDIAQLFDKTQQNRPKEILQLFLYAYMYRQKYNTTDIIPSVVFLRSIFKDGSIGTIKQKIDRKTEQIKSFDPFEQEFVETFTKCLTEIFDPTIPFTQTENKKACEYCGFASLCS